MRGWFEGWLPPPVSDAPGGLLSFTPAVEANPNRAIGTVMGEQRSTHTTPINSAHLISSAGVVQGGGGNPLLSQTLLGVHCRSPRRCGVPKMAIGLYRGSEDLPCPPDIVCGGSGGGSPLSKQLRIAPHHPGLPCPQDIACGGQGCATPCLHNCE